MSRVSTYLNFMGQTEEAFRFYGSVFGTDIEGDIFRLGDMPGPDSGAQLTDAEKKLVAHVTLPILAGHVLMGTDMVSSMGHELKLGNNITINLEPDTRAETDRLYSALADGGSESTGMQDMPWGYWGCSLDRYGVRWMFNCYEAPPGGSSSGSQLPAGGRRPSRIITRRRSPWSATSVALVHMGETSCMRSAPSMSVRASPASCARRSTRSHAAVIRSRDAGFRSGFFSKASWSSLRNVRLARP